jgi:hypothetical protein
MHSRINGSSITTGFHWSNTSDTFVDIFHNEDNRVAHWMSESGGLELFIFPSATP